MGRRNKRPHAECGGDASAAAGSAADAPAALTVVEEGAARCLCTAQHAKLPGSQPGFFNPKMRQGPADGARHATACHATKATRLPGFKLRSITSRPVSGLASPRQSMPCE
jgi:hypothetical protein